MDVRLAGWPYGDLAVPGPLTWQESGFMLRYRAFC